MAATIGFTTLAAVGDRRGLGRGRWGCGTRNFLMDRLQLASLHVTGPKIGDKTVDKSELGADTGPLNQSLHPEVLPPFLGALSTCRVLGDDSLDTGANGRERVFEMGHLFLARKAVGRSLEQFLYTNIRPRGNQGCTQLTSCFLTGRNSSLVCASSIEGLEIKCQPQSYAHIEHVPLVAIRIGKFGSRVTLLAWRLVAATHVVMRGDRAHASFRRWGTRAWGR